MTQTITRPQLLFDSTWPCSLSRAVRDAIAERLPEVEEAEEVSRIYKEIEEAAPYLRKLLMRLEAAVNYEVAMAREQGLEAGLYYGLHPERLLLGEGE